MMRSIHRKLLALLGLAAFAAPVAASDLDRLSVFVALDPWSIFGVDYVSQRFDRGYWPHYRYGSYGYRYRHSYSPRYYGYHRYDRYPRSYAYPRHYRHYPYDSYRRYDRRRDHRWRDRGRDHRWRDSDGRGERRRHRRDD